MKKTNTKKFLNLILLKKRLLTRDEAFEFYIDHIMQNDASCKLNQYLPGFHYDDYALWELENKAASWHTNAIGSLVLHGQLKIKPTFKK